MTAGAKVAKILADDDDQTMCELLERTLRRDGLEVEWRTSGLDALELSNT